MTISSEELVNVILGVGLKLREAGKRVSTAELVKAAELAESYRALTGSLTRSDLASILAASFTTIRVPLDLLEDLIAKELAGRGVRERAERITKEIRAAMEAMGAKPGDRVSRKKITRRKSGKERRLALASYTKLRNIGAIRGKPGNERILPLHELEKLAWSIARDGYESLDQASKAMMRKDWDDLLTAVEAGLRPDTRQLEKLSERTLLNLAAAARKKHDKLTRELVAEEFARRINAGERVNRPDEVAELLEEAGFFTPILRRKLASYSKLDPEKLSADDIVELANTLDPETGGRLLSKKMNSLTGEEATRVLQSVNPRLFWALGKNSIRKLRDPLLEAAVEAAKGVREALKYAQTREEGRADMAKYYIDRAMAKLQSISEGSRGTRSSNIVDESSILSMIHEASAIVKLVSSLDEATDPHLIGDALRGLDYTAKLRLLKDIYGRSSPEWQKIILYAAEQILNRLSTREGLRLLRERYHTHTPPGRIDVRRSIYGTIRHSPQPIVYMKRRRTARLTLALDVSGSMVEYSTWALAVASLFPRHLQRLVMFSHYTRVYEGPFTKREFVRALFEAEFKGYTNISKALREASIPGVKKIVVITDLRQTVIDEPVDTVVHALVRSGKRIVFIIPKSHDEYTRRLVEESGGKVILASTPRKAAQHLLRILLRS